jgi:hypothetical protein
VTIRDLSILVCAAALGGTALSAQDAARGAALLEQTRQALGAKGLAGVKTLQVTGTFRRVVGGSDTEGDFDVFIELPDKYLRSEKTGTPGQPSTETIEALVAGDARDAVRGGRGAGGGGRGGGGADEPGASDAAGDAPPDGDREQEREAADAQQAEAAAGAPAGRGRGAALDQDAGRRARQAEVGRLLLMWLVRSDVPLPWVGVAQSPDGTADVLEARYADGQPTRFFLETKTHLPLMMQWTAAPAGGAARGGRRGGRGAGDAAAPRQGGPPPQPEAMTMTFSEYREVNGVRFPTVITRAVGGQTIERWAISRYRVNPAFSAETFTR